MGNTYQVLQVEGRRSQREFIRLPWKLYQGDPNWVPPLITNQEELVGFRHHPFYDENKIRTFLVKKNGVTCGRIAALTNQGHCQRYNEKRGFFGFFECIDDQEAANLLFTEACNFLRSEGMSDVRGPCNPSLNTELGTLVEGFNSPPTFMMTYNPPYHDRLIKGFGFEKVQDLYAFDADTSMLDSLDPKLGFIIEEVKRRFNVKVRRIDTKNFDAEVRTFLDIYNKSLEGTWGFVPMSEAEVIHAAKGLKMLIETDLTTMIEVNGKIVAAGLGLLDYNPLIKKIGGKLFPFGFLWLLYGRKSIKRVRLLSTNVLPEWQRWGLGLVLLERMLPDCLARGVTHAEFSWVLESNQLSRGSLERGGAKKSKTYRLYDRSLSNF